MTGARGSRKYKQRMRLCMENKYTLRYESFYKWIGDLINQFTVIGPVLKKRRQTVFEKLDNLERFHLDYCSTMLAPRKYIYRSRQKLMDFDRENNSISSAEVEKISQIIIGIHPCDMQAITVLDRTFLGDYTDAYYSALRDGSITIVLNCNNACNKGFCASMNTGPFLRLHEGYDMEITRFTDRLLIEAKTDRSVHLIEKASGLKEVREADLTEKSEIATKATASFTKSIDTRNLPELLLRNIGHPVYKDTADSRCLGCTNCTMVCPTCFCYNFEETTSFDLKKTERNRYWDSCQELHFAQVHGGNFRSSREARLRQFVTHKLGTWIEQYGCFGCVGCGRCMTWCPTGIDLTEMAIQIQEDYKLGKIK